MDYRHVIVIGTSAGGVYVLKKLLSLLPADFPAPILIVMHLQPHSISRLPEVMSRYSKLPVIHPVDGQTLRPGHIYVAPPDLHMVVSDGHIYLRYGPKINYSRPAIDPLFCSAALCAGTTIGIILSGMLNDGVVGLLAIKNKNGITIVQDLDEAEYKMMPQNAMEQVAIDYCLPVSGIATLLTRLVKH